MIDLYLALVPVYAVLATLALVALKCALMENSQLAQAVAKAPVKQRQAVPEEEQEPLRDTIRHLMLNFTLLETCSIRRAPAKVTLLLSISVIALATFFTPQPFVFSFAGSVVVFAYFFLKMALTHPSDDLPEHDPALITRQKYQQVAFTSLTMAFSFALIGLTYKNYMNSTLAQAATAFGINLALDNFAVRPFVTLIAAVPLSRSQTVIDFISREQRQEEALQLWEQTGGKAVIEKPGKQFSPSKIPHCVPVNLQIEPVPMQRPSEQKLNRSIDLLKRLKKEHALPPIFTTARKHNEPIDNSLNSLLNSTNKKMEEDTSIIVPQSDKGTELPVKIGGRIDMGENLVMVNPSRLEEMAAEQDRPEQQLQTICHQRNITQESIPDSSSLGGGSNNGVLPDNEGLTLESYRTRELQVKMETMPQNVGSITLQNVQTSGTVQPIENQPPLRGEEPQPLRISMLDFEKNTSRHQPLRICLNGQERPATQFSEEAEVQMDVVPRRRETLNLDHHNAEQEDNFSSQKNTLGVLEIKRQNTPGEDLIDEINFNSPTKSRKTPLGGLEAESKLTAKKKKKRLSQDQQRVIRFSTGEPYLEYLPHMLNKDSKKKSQALSRKKEVVIDERVISSVKRPPKRKQFKENDENLVPAFRIQQL